MLKHCLVSRLSSVTFNSNFWRQCLNLKIKAIFKNGEWQAVKSENNPYRPALPLTAAHFYSTPDFKYFSVMRALWCKINLFFQTLKYLRITLIWWGGGGVVKLRDYIAFSIYSWKWMISYLHMVSLRSENGKVVVAVWQIVQSRVFFKTQMYSLIILNFLQLGSFSMCNYACEWENWLQRKKMGKGH